MIWDKFKLQDACQKIVDCEHKTAPTQEKGFPSIRTPNIGKGRLLLDGVNLVSEEVWSEWTKREVPQYNDLILAREAPLGNVAMIPDNIKLCLGQRTVLLRPNSEKVLPRFLCYLLLSPNMQHTMHSRGGGATVAHLNVKEIRELPIQLPPLPTQKKIANILSAYDDLIENNLKRIKLLEEMAQLTYEEWFVRMKFPEYEQAVIDSETELPEGWKIDNIGYKYKTGSGGTPSKSHSEYYDMGRIPWVRTQELRNNLILGTSKKISDLGLKKSSAKVFPANTVLLAMYGNTIGETGYLMIPASTNQACCAFLTDEFNSYYIHQYLMFHKQQVLNYRMGAAQENISQEIIKKIKILHPHEDTIIQFGEKMKPIYLTVASLLKQNQHLKEVRDILLPRLMTGMIDIDMIQLPRANISGESQ